MLTAEQYKRAEFGFAIEESKRGFKIHAAVYATVITGADRSERAPVGVHGRRTVPVGRLPDRRMGIGLTFHYIYGYRHPEPQIRARQREVEAYAERTTQPV